MALGGKRPGAGRKKGQLGKKTVAEQEAKLLLIEMIKRDADKLYAAWQDAALGHFFEAETPEGKKKVYKKPPNPEAIRNIFERAFGRPKQELDVTSGGEPIHGFEMVIPLDDETSDQTDKKAI